MSALPDSMKLHLLLPDAFPATCWEDPRAFDEAPSLARTLARGVATSIPWPGLGEWVCRQFGVVPEPTVPTAAITMLGDDGMPGTDWWIRADPVHLALTIDSLVVAPLRDEDVGAAEATALADALNVHFADRGIEFHALHPRRWYLRLPEPLVFRARDPDAIGGTHVPSRSSGEPDAAARALANEIQMVLHEHPVNAAREDAGRLPINSLWLWGEGRLPTPMDRTFDIVRSDHPAARGCARLVGVETRPSPRHGGEAIASGAPARIFASLPPDRGATGADALGALERDWFDPLWRALCAKHLSELRLTFPHTGRDSAIDVRLLPADTWKFWRRRRARIPEAA